MRVDVAGRKATPCDDEGDQLYGYLSLNDDVEDLNMEFTARATHFCKEGASPEWIIYADSARPVKFGMFALEGASVYAEGLPPASASASVSASLGAAGGETLTKEKGLGLSWLVTVAGSVSINLESAVAVFPGIQGSVAGYARGTLGVSSEGVLTRQSPVTVEVDVVIKKGVDPSTHRPMLKLTGRAAFTVPCVSGVSTIKGVLELNAGDMKIGPLRAHAAYACGDDLSDVVNGTLVSTPRYAIAVGVDTLPLTKNIVVFDAFLSAEIYELDASAEQYLIKVNGSGSVPIPMGAFKVGADVAFLFEYDSAAGSSTMTSLLVDASVSATIGDPAAPNFELEGRAVYEYPCTTTVSATGTVNMTFDSNFRVGPLETSLVLYCPSNANEHELKSEEQLQGSKTAFVLSVMTGKDGIVELTLGDAVLTASDVRIMLVGKEDASTPPLVDGAGFFPFPDFASLDLEGTVTATLKATAGIGGDASGGDAQAAIAAELDLAAAFSKDATADDFAFEYNYTALVKFYLEFHLNEDKTEFTKIDLTGRKSDPCDEEEGDSLSGTFEISSEKMSIGPANARAVHHCREGASPAYVIQAHNGT